MQYLGLLLVPFLIKTLQWTQLDLIYRFLEEDSSCVEFGCSYSKDGFSDNVYCFKPGPYKFEAGEQCPTETSGTDKALTNIQI